MYIYFYNQELIVYCLAKRLAMIACVTYWTPECLKTILAAGCVQSWVNQGQALVSAVA